MRVAVIDLGTNTFNLLIADIHASGFEIVHNSKEGVALGMGGINEQTIHPDAEKRAFHAFEVFQKRIEENSVEFVYGFGTSAIRDAKNGNDFVQHLIDRFSHPIEIIDGDREAELIYKGVTWIHPIEKASLIMDIGGGSSEFIRVDQTGSLEACSLNIGVSRAFQLFEFSDPLDEKDKLNLIDWFEKNAEILNQFGKSSVLIGASGSFETFYEMVHNEEFPSKMDSMYLSKVELDEILDWTLNSTLEERESHPYIIPIRRKLAPIAAMKVKWILDKFSIEEVVICPFSLKEGVLRELVEKYIPSHGD
jgi:exopolyphosphatase/guanosine-5'-triphosphate,3'-diphosphate pyrophosphatase